MIVVDTHALFWWLTEDQRLSTGARKALEASDVGVPSACCWELAWLETTGKVQPKVGMLEWLQKALCLPGVRLLPLTPENAVRGASLERKFPSDPGDRQIVATALHFIAPLVTRDGPITQSGLVQTIW